MHNQAVVVVHIGESEGSVTVTKSRCWALKFKTTVTVTIVHSPKINYLTTLREIVSLENLIHKFLFQFTTGKTYPKF